MQLPQNKQFELQKILNINYSYNHLTFFQREGRQLIRGSRGHNSCFFRKPIIQGKFYIQAIGYLPESTQECYKNSPSFRVGIAPTEYYYNYPLGLDFSVGYKMNGMIIQNGQVITKIEPFSFGDVMGIGINVKEVYKTRVKNRRVDTNYVQFYKNGKLAGPALYLMTEDLYTFSSSFYNEAEIQFNYSGQSIRYLPDGYRPYKEHLMEQCIYKDSWLQALQSHIRQELRLKL